jgi:hypothetical protein
MTKSDYFIKITNEDIFHKIENIEFKIDKNISSRLARLDKRVSMAVWVSSTALTLSLLIIGVLVNS